MFFTLFLARHWRRFIDEFICLKKLDRQTVFCATLNSPKGASEQHTTQKDTRNMPTIVFNTHRKYSEHGQRIAATKLADGRVQFVDVDRNINHVTKYECELTRAAVMTAYDNSEYGTTSDYNAYAVTRQALEALAHSSI